VAGEKYGDTVKFIFNLESELCGGTHVKTQVMLALQII
jgi:alanyl-tRNA synthetase